MARGAYLDAARVKDVNAEAEHRARTTAVVLSRHGAVAASHQSAAVLHGLPVLNDDLDRIRVVRTSGTKGTRVHDGLSVHRHPGPEALGEVNGIDSVIVAVAVIGTAMIAGVRSGVMAADAALHRKLTTIEELGEWVARWARFPGIGQAREVVTRACPLAESPGESLLRLVLVALKLDFVAQHPIQLSGWTCFVDFYLPALDVVVEFDGRVKYRGANGADALAAEKRREDQIRARGHGVARIEWSDLFSPARVQAKIFDAARTRARLG